MKEHMNDQNAMKNYVEKKKKIFDALPEED
jgi:hypothetical protein